MCIAVALSWSSNDYACKSYFKRSCNFLEIFCYNRHTYMDPFRDSECSLPFFFSHIWTVIIAKLFPHPKLSYQLGASDSCMCLATNWNTHDYIAYIQGPFKTNTICYHFHSDFMRFAVHFLLSNWECIVCAIIPFCRVKELWVLFVTVLDTKAFVEWIVARNGQKKHQKAKKQDNCLVHW